MSFSITNQRNNTRFVTNAGETILDAALRDGRVYPYGCRSGACGACKSDLLSGKVDYGDHEDFALSEEEKAQGKVLLCQAIPLQDVVIDVEEIITEADKPIIMIASGTEFTSKRRGRCHCNTIDDEARQRVLNHQSTLY